VPVLVAKQLNLDVARADQPPLEVDRRSPNADFGFRARQSGRRSTGPRDATVRMPLPPPRATPSRRGIADALGFRGDRAIRRRLLERRLRCPARPDTPL
jgi:hypothetical protein